MTGRSGTDILNEQVYSSPPTVSLERLSIGDKRLRRDAPYALVAAYPNQKKQRFFQYCAIACRTSDHYACIVYGVNQMGLYPYAGHFLASKEQIYDPETKNPPNTLKFMKNFEEASSNFLFGMLNRDLAQFCSYFLHCTSSKYQELHSISQDSLFAVVNQRKLRLPIEFILEKEPISDTTIQMIEDQIVPLNAAKHRLKDSGCLHGQVFLTFRPKYKQSSDVMDCAQFFDRANRTNFIAAYEEVGCMPFFETSLLLGQLDDFYIVGVYCSNSFSLIATTRIYDRASGHKIAKIPPETFLSLRLPDWIAEEQTRAYLLDIRRMLLEPAKYRKEINMIKERFNFDDYTPEKPLERIHRRKQGPNKAESKDLRNAWIKRLLDETFSFSFQNSMLEFPEAPCGAYNANMFAVNVLRLWIQELLRIIHNKELGDLSIKNSPPALEFFMMTISEFIKKYLILFGLSPDCNFQCRKLDSHGNPGEICIETLPTSSIGKHVYLHHVAPLLGDAFSHFIPFILVPPPYVTLSNYPDHEKLEKCRSVTRLWENIPYIKILKQFKTFACELPSEDEDQPVSSTVCAENDAAEPYREHFVEVSNFMDAAMEESDAPYVNWTLCTGEEPKVEDVAGSSVNLTETSDEPSSTESDKSPKSKRGKYVRTDARNDETEIRRASKRLLKKEVRKRKRESFEMSVLSKVMRERNVM